MGLRMETPKERASAFFSCAPTRETIGKASWRSTFVPHTPPFGSRGHAVRRRPHAPVISQKPNLKAPRVHWCIWLTLVLRLSCGRLAPALRCSCAQALK